MKDSSKKSALFQLLGLALIFVILSAYVLGSFYVRSRSEARDYIEKKFISAAEDRGNQVETRLSGLAETAAPIGSLLGKAGLQDREESVRLLGALADNTDAYLAVYAGPSGSGVDSRGRDRELSGEAYFSMLEETAFFYGQDEGTDEKNALIAAVPCRENGKTSGMLYVYLDSCRLEEMLELPAYGDKAFYLLTDGGGTIMAQGGYPGNFAAEGNLKKAMGRAEFDGEESPDTAWKKIQGYKEGTIAVSMDGAGYELFFSPIGINDWRFYVGVREEFLANSRNEYLAPVRKTIVGILLTVGLFSGLLLITNFINKYFYNEHKKVLEEKASKDLLTDLSNKTATEYLIKDYIETHPDSQGLLFVLDVDNFKKINDTQGHAFGDEVLRKLGTRLRGECRITDIVGRTGGDEFIIFMKDIKEESIFIKEAQRLHRFFGDFQVGEYVKYSPAASIGVAVYPRDGRTFEELYKAADSALYSVKRNGKNGVAFYETKMNVKME